MSDVIYNIRKLENFKEYLNQKMISPRLLNNPRIYEILNMISDDFNLVQLDEETKNIFDTKLLIDGDGNISYLKDLKRVKVKKNPLGFELIVERYDKKTSKVVLEKRQFDINGIEYLYEIREGLLSIEGFENDVGIIPKRKIRYVRDNSMLNFIMKEEVGEVVIKEYFIQQVPYMLQNLKLTKAELSRISNHTKIEELCTFLTRNQAEFDMIKQLFNEEKFEGENEIFKTYCSYNKRLFLPTTYEKAVAKKLGINIERYK